MLMLAANLDVQDWIAEEICEVLQDSSSGTWDYATYFPKLKRCYAILVSR